MNILSEIYQYLDDLFDENTDADTLFASGYLRGLISLSATDFGDEQQIISPALIQMVTAKLSQTKTELSPQDFTIVHNFWLILQSKLAVF